MTSGHPGKNGLSRPAPAINFHWSKNAPPSRLHPAQILLVKGLEDRSTCFLTGAGRLVPPLPGALNGMEGWSDLRLGGRSVYVFRLKSRKIEFAGPRGDKTPRGVLHSELCKVFFNPSCAVHNRTIFAVDEEDSDIGVIDE